MATIQELSVLVGADLSGYQRGMQSVRDGSRSAAQAGGLSLDGISQSLDRVGDRASKLAGNLAGVFLPAGAALGWGISVASDFESTLTEIEVRAGLTAEGIDDIREASLALGADTAFSAQQAADAYLQLLTSGSTVEEALATLPSVLDAAAASGEDLGQTADVITDIMAAFQLSAGVFEDGSSYSQMVVDALAQAAGASSATMGSLGEGFANVGGQARAFGLSVEDTAAILAIFSENGIKGAEAGTALRSMLTNMTRETADVKAAWNALGTSMYDQAGNIRPLQDVLEDIRLGLDGKTEQQQNQILQDLAGTYGILGLRAALGAVSIDEMLAKMHDSATASEVADARMDTFSGAVDSLKGSIETFMITAGTPFIENVLQPMAVGLTDVVNKVTEWADENPELVSSIMGLVLAGAIAVPVLWAISSVANALSGIIGTISAVGKYIGNTSLARYLGGTRLLLLGFAGAAAAAAVAFGPQIIEAVEETVFDVKARVTDLLQQMASGVSFGDALFNWLRTEDKYWQIRSGIENTFAGIKFDISAQMSGLREYLMAGDGEVALFDARALINGILGDINNALNSIGDIDTSGFQTWIEGNFSTLAHLAVSAAGIIFGGPFGAALGIGNLIARAIKADFLGISTFLDETGIRTNIELVAGLIRDLVEDAWSSIFGGGASDNLLPGMNPAEELAMAVSQPGTFGIFGKFGQMISDGVEALKDLFDRIGPGLGEALNNFFSGITGFVSALQDTDMTGVDTVIVAIAGALGGLLTVIGTGVITAVETGLNVVGDILPALGETISNVVEAVGSLGQGDIAGVISNLGEAIGTFVSGIITIPINLGDGLLSFFERILDVDLPSVEEQIRDLAVMIGLIDPPEAQRSLDIDLNIDQARWAIGPEVASVANDQLKTDMLTYLAVYQANNSLDPAPWSTVIELAGRIVNADMFKAEVAGNVLRILNNTTVSPTVLITPNYIITPPPNITNPETGAPFGQPQPPIDGSNAWGLERVPFDGYVSELHEDEAVLTAPEAAVWRRMKAGGFAMAGSGHGAPLTSIGQVNISTYGEAPDELARLVARRFRDQSIGGGMFGG